MTAGLFTAALVLVIGAAVLWFARKAGRDSVRADNAESTVSAVKVRHEIESNLAATPGDRKRLRDEWTSR